jgi:2-keto-4-pentenoate hydratase/2-oxohepta-3-ene-1,7-dioic acid hydratase in catechol pathway
VRFAREGRVAPGILDGDTILELEGDLFAGTQATGGRHALSEVTLLTPCQPSKVIAVGLNYRSHLQGRPQPEYPGLFAKFPSTLIADGQPIVIPADAAEVHYEGELVVVIGRRARKVTAAQAPGHVFGVTVGNDISERRWQRGDLQWVRAKGSDSFGPVGPVIATGLDYGDLSLETRLNGELRQSAHTSDLIFGVDLLVSFISRYLTLEPGDLVFTGTPGSTEAMRPGDVVEVEIEGVGTLRNPVVAEQASA